MLKNTKHVPKASLWFLLVASLLWSLPALACGSFAPRPTPSPTPPIPVEPFTTSDATAENGATPPELVVNTPVPLVPTATPAPVPTATFTATPQPGTALRAGEPARVTAPAGLNMRTSPSSGGSLVLQLGTGQLVTVVEGPTQAENFTWWRVDDGQGNSGWVAEGDNETVWLSPQVGQAQPVNRPPRVGDRVVVTMPNNGQLSVRALPGTDAALLTRVDSGAQLTVLDGPQQASGLTWYRVRSDSGATEGWAADGDGEDRWLSPLE
ncbi:MAG: SH3 domain-containing protein [Caldilineaceae bacterium]|nr:SH3 domain-containing protein [Caldilineaceae bacterium]